MNNTKVKLEDGWTTSSGYKEQFQASEEIVHIVEQLDLKEGHALLDNGCGNGEFSLHAARTTAGIQVFGFDALDSATTEATSRAQQHGLDQATYQKAWADNLPLDDATADRVLFRFVLHHIAKPELPFQEMARCMKSDALLVLQTPYNHWDEAFTEFLKELFLVMDSTHSRHYHTLAKIAQDLGKSGLSIGSSSATPFAFPFISEPMKNLIIERGFQDRLKLEQIEEDLWSITLYKLEVKAEKFDA